MMLLREWGGPDLSGRPAASPTHTAADWIVVASAEHVRAGVALGIMQVWHGNAAPLRRIIPGSRIACYSPTESFCGSDRLQCFTAFGIVLERDIFQVDLGDGFRPHRRRVRYLHNREAPVGPLRERPGFVLSGPAWGQRLRPGLLHIDAASMDTIARAMGAGEGAAGDGCSGLSRMSA